jgi:hypothetical protein
MPLEDPFRLQAAESQGFGELVMRDAVLAVKLDEVGFAGFAARVDAVGGKPPARCWAVYRNECS